ncbi:MAG TPA: hypothetical protein VFS31_00065, partial [Chitinophagaceae bacterium]|nr:hypothetical protein [Chitinophagaceae bacterium]
QTPLQFLEVTPEKSGLGLERMAFADQYQPLLSVFNFGMRINKHKMSALDRFNENTVSNEKEREQ